MPAGDGTGPMGAGPRTGRAAGYCAGYDNPGWASPMAGRGMGMGRGRAGGGGRGWRRRNWYYATGLPGWMRFGSAPAMGVPPAWARSPYGAPPTREQETESLRQQAELLKQQLDFVSQRIEELQTQE